MWKPTINPVLLLPLQSILCYGWTIRNNRRGGGVGTIPPKKLMRGKLVWKEKSCKQWHRKKNSCGGQKKKHADTSAKKKKQNKIRGPKKFCPLPVISTLDSLIIIWRLWQRFFSWRQSGARKTPTVWNWFGRTVCPILFISWTLFSFARLQFPYLHWLSEDGF